MHFFLLGATGRTGQRVLSELLSQGHTAVALVRNASKLTPTAGLTIVTGSPLSKSDVQRALSANTTTLDGAIFTLNTVRKSDNPFAAQVSPPRFLADSCANACAALEQAGVRRIVITSTAGVGDSWDNLPMLSKGFMSLTNVKYALEDHGILDREIRETGMEWTLVRAVKLDFDEGKRKSNDTNEVKVLGSGGKGMRVTDSVYAANVARFLIKVAVEGSYSREAVVIRD